MCDFKPGDEVVCVDDSVPTTPGRQPWVCRLRKGEVYTVCGVSIHPKDKHLCIHLVQVQNIWIKTGEDVGFKPSRFRKVQRRDLSAWLSQSVKNTDKLDKPHRAPERA